MTTATDAATPATVNSTAPVAAPASRLQVAGVVVLAAGIGWLNGNFIQPIPPAYGAFIDLLHLAPLLILVPLAMSLFTKGATRGVRNGVTGVVAFMLLTCAAFIILGAVNPNPNSVGVHDLTDWAVVASVTTGGVLWLAGLLPGARRAAAK
jgi:hypothetical protein